MSPKQTHSTGDIILSGTPFILAEAGPVGPGGVARPGASEEQIQYPASRQASGGFGYGDFPPNIEAVWYISDWTGGYGQKLWRAGGNRYYYAFADGRIPGQWSRPPELNSQAVTAEDRGHDHFERTPASTATKTLFACNGRYITYWTAPTSITNSVDLGTGLIAKSAANFQGAGAAFLTYVAIETSSGMPQPYRTFTAATPTTVWASDTQATDVTPAAAIYDDNGVFTEDTTDPLTLTLSSLVAAQDKVYVRGVEPFEGLNVNMNAANGDATVMTIKYWNGTTYTAVAGGSDGTSSGGVSFTQDGNVTWTLPTDWAPDTINGTTGYHIQLTWSVAFDASTTTTDIDLIQRSTAKFFAAFGSKLYRVVKMATIYQLQSSTDGGTAATWTNVGTITDVGNPVTAVRVLANTLLIFSEQGMFQLEADGTTLNQQVWPHERSRSDSNNGVGSTVWRGVAWVPSIADLYAMQLSESVLVIDDTVGPGRLLDNDSPVRGVVTCFAGDDYFGYALMQDEDGVSYLLSFDINKRKWHPLLNVGSITSRHAWVSDVGHATNPLLYFFAGDDLRWIILPRSSPDPTADSATRFDVNTTGVGQIYIGRFGSPLEFEVKAWLTGKAIGEDWSATDTLKYEYRTTDDGAWQTLDTWTTDPVEQENFSTSVSSRFIEVRLTLGGSSTSTTPILRSVYTGFAVRYPFKRIFTYTLKLADNQAMAGGSKRMGTAQELRRLMNVVAASTSPITLEIPATGDSFDTLPVDYRIYAVFNTTSKAWEWQAFIELVEYQSTVFGTWARAAAYTWAQAESSTWAQFATTA